jgi:predicted lipoprotein with Yx(FWY)xxD motif
MIVFMIVFFSSRAVCSEGDRCRALTKYRTFVILYVGFLYHAGICRDEELVGFQPIGMKRKEISMKSRYAISMIATAAVLVVVLAGLAVAVVDTPQIKYKEGVGNYLADGKGITLYYFKKDQPDRNACTGTCLEIWPIYHAEQIKAPAGSDAKDFGEFTRPDGKKQTTFKNWPLYYFANDKAPGDTNGQGVKNLWSVINPISIPSCF